MILQMGFVCSMVIIKIRSAQINLMLATTILLIVSTMAIAENEANFPRHPTLSPDGSELAFSYGGDIWKVSTTGGEAALLTTNPAYDHSPRWSPNGKWIAFNSKRNGDNDLYIVPAIGGNSKRLTFSERDDGICSWTPDSKSIIFSSRRYQRYPNYRLIYKIPSGGGTPQLVIDNFADKGMYSPNQDKILYTRNGVRWWRKGYRGSGAGTVWMYDFNTKEHTNLSSVKRRNYEIPLRDMDMKNSGAEWVQQSYGASYQHYQADWALWGKDNSIYVVAEWDGTFNLYRQRNNDNKWTQITYFTEDGVRFPTISNNGELIAFERGTDIYTLVDDSIITRINIIAPLETRHRLDERIEYKDKAGRVSFTSDGNQMIVELRGEIFASWVTDKKFKSARGEANSLTRNNSARDGDFSLSPGGDSLVFVSDRDGNKNLYLTFSENQKLPELARARNISTIKLTNSNHDDHSPRWSPDGKSVAFIRGKGDLIIYNIKKGVERKLLSGWSLKHHTWSPDSKWLAFSRDDNDYNTDIFVISVKDGTTTNISRHPDEDEFPVWSDDGKKLGFRSRRRANNWDIYFVFLTEVDHFKGQTDRIEEDFYKSLLEEDDDKDEKKKKKKRKNDRNLEINVVIDTLDIHRRIRSVTGLSGNEGILDISPDCEKFAFLSDHEGENDIYMTDWTGKDLNRLTEGGTSPRWFKFDPNGDNIRYLTSSGVVKSVNIDKAKVKSIPFTAVLHVDHVKERLQKFNEMWRWLDDRYYDAEFHGVDWQSLHDKYELLIPMASTEEDFGDIANMMIGELNSSHSGYRSPRKQSQHSVGHIGLDFDFEADGEGLLISHVLKNGSCDRNGVHLNVRDRLLAINGTSITDQVNINELLDYTVNKKVELTVEIKGKQSTVMVRAQSHGTIGRIRYEDWVKVRRAIVDSISEYNLGYLHIRGMGEGSMARFESELFSVAEGKDALVIDVRYNGGGWTTDFLLAMLQVKRHAVTFPRDGGPGYPQGRLPLYSWVKPIIVLCNEHSFSNAEIFSHAIKTLGRGTLVGVPTPGGVISTGWHGLLDGSGFRVPLRGWYTGTDPIRNSHRNMEGNGALPNIFVPMFPGQMAMGDDVQLSVAVKELLEQLGD